MSVSRQWPHLFPAQLRIPFESSVVTQTPRWPVAFELQEKWRNRKVAGQHGFRGLMNA